MFNQINRKIFSKLYHYYCRKLLERGGMILLMSFLSLFLLTGLRFALNEVDQTYTGMRYVGTFWLISLAQMFGMIYIITNLIARLVGYQTGFSASFRRYSSMAAWKKSGNEDITVLHLTPGIDRQTLILAKYVAVATFFFLINFFFYVLPIAVYLAFSAKMSLLAVSGFVLLNGLVFSVANFLWLVPLLFYFYEEFNLLLFLVLFVIFLVAVPLSIAFSYKIFAQYPLLLPLLSLPLSGIFGYSFFRLYWRKFLKKDLV